MDQAQSISPSPQLESGGAPPDLRPISTLDLLKVAKPEHQPAQTAEQVKAAEPPTMGQFFAGLERDAAAQQAETLAKGQASTPSAKISGPEVKAQAPNFSINLDQHYLNNDLILKSLDASNLTYTPGLENNGSQTLNNIKGLSINLAAFGKEKRLAIKSITIEKDDSGKRSFSLQVENPLPPAAEKILDASSTLPLSFSLDASGKLTNQTDSEILYALSKQSNTTLPGMVLSDAFKDAGSVAQFIEKNPVWVNNILAPFMSRFGDYLKSNLNANIVIDKPAQNTTAKMIDRIMPKIAGASASDANSQAIKGPGDYHETMTIDGHERKLWVHVPPGYDAKKPMPLVVLIHGMAQKGNDLEYLIGGNKLADKEGFVAIYPDATDWFNVKDLRTWDSGNGLVLPGQHAGDLHFMANIISTAQQQLNIDPMRVYLAGFSNGGMLAYEAAGELSGTIASVAILSSAMSGKEPRPKEPLSLINVHGTADAIIPYQGLTDTPPVLTDVGVPVFQPTQYGTDYYKSLDKITEPYTVTKVGNLTIESAANPANGTAVEQITVAGAGHFLSNREALLQQVWDFLKAHPRTAPPDSKDNNVVEPDVPVENLTTVQQLLSDVEKRGTTGIEQDLDNVFDAARSLPDNTISPSAIFDKITNSTHINFNDPVSRFIDDTTALSKKQDQITIDRKTDASIPVDLNFGVGTLQSLDIGKVSFQLNKNNGYPELKNISGITLKAQLAGFNLSSRIKDMTELPDGPAGVDGRIYRATMQNPLPGWARTILMSPNQFNVDLKFGSKLNPLFVNQNNTERQLLGRNLWINGIADEAQDAADLTTNFSGMNALKLGSDAGITAGLVYAGMRLGGPRAKLVGALCFLAAPLAIDFVRKELSH